MPKAIDPLRNGLETLGLEMRFAMLLPEPPGVRMTVKRKNKRTHWVLVTLLHPGRRPLIARQTNPSGGTPKLALRVRLFGVSLL